MEEEELRQYLQAQIKEINKYKWIESQKAKCDIGYQKAAFEWIRKYGKDFRHYWISIKNNSINV